MYKCIYEQKKKNLTLQFACMTYRTDYASDNLKSQTKDFL